MTTPLAENIIALIPARGGSRGLPRKNLQLLGGKPLLVWTVETALACPSLPRVMVSTEDAEIAAAAREAGAEVPFARPADLAGDDTPDFPVYRHALDWLAREENTHPDIVVWLRPTDPLRTVEDIEQALRILLESDADCLRSVCPARQHPYWMKRINQDRLVPFMESHTEIQYPNRQSLPSLYYLNGAVDIVRCGRVPKHGPLFSDNLCAYVMPEERSLDIDGPEDLARAEWLIGHRTA